MARLLRNTIKKIAKPLMPWLPAPTALPIGKGGWHEWERDLLKKYPIRFRLFHVWPEDIDIFFSIWHRRLIKDPIWALKYRFVKKHQYHVIRPSTLKPNYHDYNTRILHTL
jgi:hypothetical protein